MQVQKRRAKVCEPEAYTLQIKIVQKHHFEKLQHLRPCEHITVACPKAREEALGQGRGPEV